MPLHRHYQGLAPGACMYMQMWLIQYKEGLFLDMASSSPTMLGSVISVLPVPTSALFPWLGDVSFSVAGSRVWGSLLRMMQQPDIDGRQFRHFCLSETTA